MQHFVHFLGVMEELAGFMSLMGPRETVSTDFSLHKDIYIFIYISDTKIIDFNTVTGVGTRYKSDKPCVHKISSLVNLQQHDLSS